MFFGKSHPTLYVYAKSFPPTLPSLVSPSCLGPLLMRMLKAEARKRLSALGLEEEKSLIAEAAIASEVSRDGRRVRRGEEGCTLYHAWP